MKTERDKFLTEYIGKCWHEWDEYWDEGVEEYFCECKKCCFSGYSPAGYEDFVVSFSTYEGLGLLIQWLKGQELWSKIRWHMPMAEFMELMTDPDEAADRLYAYLKEKTK